MIPLPPRSPLFPYTTLFRSVAVALKNNVKSLEELLTAKLDGVAVSDKINDQVAKIGEKVQLTRFERVDELNFLRSEEHTSELQSPVHLVCRLLLEKKKKKKK